MLAAFFIIQLRQVDNLSPTNSISSNKYSPSTTLRIGTWNLRVPFPSDTKVGLNWENRVDGIARAIASQKPNVLAVQEDFYSMSSSLLSHPILEPLQYDRYGLFNRNGMSGPPDSTWPINPFTRDGIRDGEHNSVWHDSTTYANVSSSTFWLSETPSIPGTSFGEVTGRVVNCRVLRAKVWGSTFGFCSLHFPTDREKGNRSIYVLSQEIRNIVTKEELSLVFVAGDFNFVEGSTLYQTMISQGFLDIRQLAGGAHGEFGFKNVTTKDWNGAADQIIDYIWIYGTRANSLIVDLVTHIPVYLQLNGQHNNHTASDHLLVIMDIVF